MPCQVSKFPEDTCWKRPMCADGPPKAPARAHAICDSMCAHRLRCTPRPTCHNVDTVGSRQLQCSECVVNMHHVTCSKKSCCNLLCTRALYGHPVTTALPHKQTGVDIVQPTWHSACSSHHVAWRMLCPSYLPAVVLPVHAQCSSKAMLYIIMPMAVIGR